MEARTHFVGAAVCLCLWSLPFSCGDLCIDVFPMLALMRFTQLLAGLLLRLALGVLGLGHLAQDVGGGPPNHSAVQVRHHGVERLGARLGNVGQ
jgi:hypothetical protein